MKKAIESGFDSAILYQNMSIPESDCFGKEFDTHAFECQVCAAKAFCQTIQHQTNKKRVKQLEQQQPFFDLVNFDVIDKDELVATIENGEYTKDQLIDAVMELSKADKNLATKWFEIFCKEHFITIEENGACTK